MHSLSGGSGGGDASSSYISSSRSSTSVVPDTCSALHKSTLSELAASLKASLQWNAQEGILDFGVLGDGSNRPNDEVGLNHNMARLCIAYMYEISCRNLSQGSTTL